MATRLAYPLAEAATLLGVKSTKTVHREIKAGNLKAARVRGRVVVLHSELERYLLSHQSPQAPTRSRATRRQTAEPVGRGKVVRLIDITAGLRGVSS